MNAFRGDSLLASIDLGHGVETIGEYAFAGNKACASLTLPSSLKLMRASAFVGTTALRNLIIEDSADTLTVKGWRVDNQSQFYGSPIDTFHYGRNYTGSNPMLAQVATLKTVEIGPQVTSMHINDFMNCTAITDVVSKAEVAPVCFSNVFSAATYNNATLWVPARRVDHYRSQPYWQQFLAVKEIDAPVVPGDVNGDNMVDVGDLNSLLNEMLSGAFNAAADLNRDGKIDVSDLNAIINLLLSAN